MHSTHPFPPIRTVTHIQKAIVVLQRPTFGSNTLTTSGKGSLGPFLPKGSKSLMMRTYVCTESINVPYFNWQVLNLLRTTSPILSWLCSKGCLMCHERSCLNICWRAVAGSSGHGVQWAHAVTELVVMTKLGDNTQNRRPHPSVNWVDIIESWIRGFEV